MIKNPFETLSKLAEEYCAKIEHLNSARILKFNKSEVLVEVTVPEDVLEWFIDAKTENGQSTLEWWCEYEGYDKASREELVNRMSSDIDTIVRGLLVRDIRITAIPKSFLSKCLFQPTRYNLEWLHDRNWEVALE